MISIFMCPRGHSQDGPSAGITMLVALVSLLKGVPAKQSLAMTGRSRSRANSWRSVNKGKIACCFTQGIKEIIIPWKNKEELSEIPNEQLSAVKIILARGGGRVSILSCDPTPAGHKPSEPSGRGVY